MIDEEKYTQLLSYALEQDGCRAVKLWLSKDSSKSHFSFGQVLLYNEQKLFRLIEVTCQNNLADLLAIILKTSVLSQGEHLSDRPNAVSQRAGHWVKIALDNESEGVETILDTFFPTESKETKARYSNSNPYNMILLSNFKKLFIQYTEYLPVFSFLLSMCVALALSLVYVHSGLNQSLFVHGLNILGQIIVWMSFWLVWNIDPGYLPTPIITPITTATHDLTTYLNLLSGLEKALSQGFVRSSKVYCCHICKHSRPLRAGHSVTTNRCVRVYDHFCVFLYRDIGKSNYIYFLSYLFNMSVVCIPQYLRLTALFLRQHMLTTEYNTSTLLLVCKAFTVWTFLIWLFITYLLCVHLYLSYLGLTSREWKYGAMQFPYINDPKMLAKAKAKDICLQDYL
ncbi:DHHC zinc finger domain-containing protein [archaeon]|nr:MAG: DHHC zinc finger domain-containing protein [archaeon]